MELKDIIKTEYVKCAKDAKYFLSKYAYIQHPLKGKILFDLYDYQRDAIDDFEAEDYNIILKGRQIGISTVVAGFATWLMLFHSDKNVLVIATKQDTAKNLVSKVKYIYKNLPVWIRGKEGLKEDNKLSMTFANGSSIKAVATSKDAARSESLSLLILDEAAFIENAKIIWGAASSTISTGGKAILLSTPNGVGNFFHKMWVDSLAKKNTFNTVLLDWRVHPDRDQAWRDAQTELLGESLAAQEHDASFIYSGNRVIAAEILEFYKNTFVTEPIGKQGFDSNLWIWEHPSPEKTYIVSADVARGDGEDYSTLHVIDAEQSAQVAEYHGKIPTKEFGDLLVMVATWYNDALLIPENSTIGWNTVQRIIDRKYKNLFYMSNDMQYVDVEHQITNRTMLSEKNMKPGFTTSQRTRPLIIAKVEEYMRENSIILRSTRVIGELDTFIWNHGRAEAMDDYNDDLVMALGIGLWVRDTALRLRQQGVELTRASLDNMVYSSTPFIRQTGYQKEDPYMYKLGPGMEEDIRWLIG